MGRVEEARAVLVQIYPPGQDIDEVIASIQGAIKQETQEQNASVSWRTLLLEPPPALRRMLLVGIGIAVCQQLVGIDAIQYLQITGYTTILIGQK
jgi:hypothetical protein